MAVPVSCGLDSSIVSSSHPPISLLFVEAVRFSTGILCSDDSKPSEQLKSPWMGSPLSDTASLKTHVAYFLTWFSPIVKIIFIRIL